MKCAVWYKWGHPGQEGRSCSWAPEHTFLPSTFFSIQALPPTNGHFLHANGPLNYWNTVISSLLLFSHSVMSDSLRPPGLQHARLPCPSLSPRVCSNSSHPLHQWCHPTISSSVAFFSFCLQSFPASGSFPISQFLASGGQSIGASSSASVFPMTIHSWFPLGWTSWISLQSKGLSRVFSSTTIWKHQFFSAQLSLWSNSHICTWLLEKP